MRFTHRVLPGLVAGSLLLGATSGAFAAKAKAKPAQRVVAAGQVSNLTATSPSAFTLTWTPKKVGATPITVQVSTTATTKEAALKGTTGALQNGEYAIAIGTKSTTGVTAVQVRFSTKPFTARQVELLRLRIRLAQLTARKAHAVRGTVNLAGTTAGSTLSVNVTTKSGVKVVKFAITTATKYYSGKALASAPPTFTDLEKVSIRFKRDAATKGLDALAIRVAATA